MSSNSSPSRAILAGGCFWCVETLYARLPGVLRVRPGYAGGHVSEPTYKAVCGGDTGHAEVVEIEFDPSRISFDDLLEVFWEVHDPTTLNRQGGDIGTQYRSAIFYVDESQRVAAEASRAAARPDFADPIVTEIVPLDRFWPAEEYHHDYYNRNPNQPYCAAVIGPKVRKFLAKRAAHG